MRIVGANTRCPIDGGPFRDAARRPLCNELRCQVRSTPPSARSPRGVRDERSRTTSAAGPPSTMTSRPSTRPSAMRRRRFSVRQRAKRFELRRAELQRISNGIGNRHQNCFNSGNATDLSYVLPSSFTYFWLLLRACSHSTAVRFTFFIASLLQNVFALGAARSTEPAAYCLTKLACLSI